MRRKRFAFEVNATTKRPLQHDGRGTSKNKSGHGFRAQQRIQTPGTVVRPGAIREFQFAEYDDLSPSSIDLTNLFGADPIRRHCRAVPTKTALVAGQIGRTML
jgi:hypothetical protein